MGLGLEASVGQQRWRCFVANLDKMHALEFNDASALNNASMNPRVSISVGLSANPFACSHHIFSHLQVHFIYSLILFYLHRNRAHCHHPISVICQTISNSNSMVGRCCLPIHSITIRGETLRLVEWRYAAKSESFPFVELTIIVVHLECTFLNPFKKLSACGVCPMRGATDGTLCPNRDG